ncbi:conserved hypothetical protein [Frankia canadensis]|uniref:Uncharacterized protein n=1 Tax=Frankia canadensis TaxID=1836972 RepID=A0A2I2KRQ5_9ACTN|nr:conserved hypothetical protein [Frankia canadensis]SOU55647.1 conserved hypothetical protein [Frankia canadensis]
MRDRRTPREVDLTWPSAGRLYFHTARDPVPPRDRERPARPRTHRRRTVPRRGVLRPAPLGGTRQRPAAVVVPPGRRPLRRLRATRRLRGRPP